MVLPRRMVSPQHSTGRGMTDWDRLAPSAKTVLADVASKLADGFTGTITLECRQGGIRNITTTQIQQPPDLAPSQPTP